MTFRARLVLTITLLLLATMGVSFASVFVIVNRSEARQFDEAIHAQAQDEAVEATLAGEDFSRIDERLGFQRDDGVRLRRYAAIYNDEGAVNVKTSTMACTNLPSVTAHRAMDAFDFVCGPEVLRGIFEPIPNGRGQILLLAVPRETLDADARFLVRTMLIAILIAILLSTLVATRVVQTLTRDHEAIAGVARRVTAGDLTARVDATSSNQEVAQLSRDINDMIVRLETLVSAQQRFIAHAAHELRSPLTSLFGQLSLALRKERDAATYKVFIVDALDSTRQLKALAEDLLALARLGKSPLDDAARGEPLPLKSLVATVTTLLQPQAAERGVTLQVELADLVVLGRARDLERLLRNLVENAVRHSPSDSIVRIRARECNGTAHIAIANGGDPIPEEDRKRVFEAFFRGGKDRASYDGAGLGLAIAREIARSHGGDVALEDRAADEPQFATCFGVTLPLADTRASRPLRVEERYASEVHNV